MEERRINWLGLFIKIVIIFILILIIIWLVSKFTNKKENTKIFEENLETMEKVSTDYFKSIDLPQKKGESEKITLGEMIDKGLVVSVKNEDGTSCDTKESYSKIIRKEKNYLIEVILSCGKEKKTTKSTLNFKDCKNCTSTENNATNNNATNSNENVTNNQNGTNKTTYYEQVKETTTYTKWMRGNITGNNVENRYEYYSVAYQTYYSTYYLREDVLKNNKEITYTLKLNSVPNNKYYFPTIEESSYYNYNDKNNYKNEKNISVFKDSLIVQADIDKHVLTEDNFEYKLQPYYREGSFYVRVTLTIKNTKNLTSYYDSNSKSNIYFVPLKLNIKFASDEIVTSIPSGEYETVAYYRYVTVDRETKWSTEKYLDGYTYTGNTKQD